MNQYVSAQIQRVLTTIELMAGHEIDGVEPKQLAAELSTSPAEVTRILANLSEAGWAERLPANERRWRLHKKPVQLSNTVDHNMKTILRNLQLESNNYSILR
ncbi:MarR family transcriptional regulator [Pseudoalteromonas sp. T1lg65]|uniref:MarR family transcriptional regulator n=1 Tax=Pseudoalteromonas sp. T1lg65 TaxID=2077101 RepID=UPI003F79B420